MAADIHNATPGPSGLSPEEIFTRQKGKADRLLDIHTFDCPVFVLEPYLQQGHKIPKWQPREHQTVYLGHSPKHAQTVPIILNLKTGLCSPQYHVVFNDYFTSMKVQQTNVLPNSWNDLFTQVNVLEGEPDIQQLIHLSPEWETEAPTVSEGANFLNDTPASSLEGANTPASSPSFSEGAKLHTWMSQNSNAAPEPVPEPTEATVHLPSPEDSLSNTGDEEELVQHYHARQIIHQLHEPAT
jgi:hypothetical protein